MIRTDVTLFDQGYGMLQLPNEMTADDLKDLERWFRLILKKRRRWLSKRTCVKVTKEAQP